MTLADLDRLQHELEIVLAADAPLELDVRQSHLLSRRQRLKQLSLYQQRLRERLQSPPTDRPVHSGPGEIGIGGKAGPDTLNPSATPRPNSLAESGSEDTRRLEAALQAYAATRSLTPVFEGLAVRGLAKQHLRRIMRGPLIYLSVLILLSALGLYLYWHAILPKITSFRLDTPKPAVASGWDYQTWLPTLMLGTSCLAVLFMLLLWLGGFYRILLGLGGKKYLDSLSAATAQRIVPQLLQAGASSEQAVLLSYELCGLAPKDREHYLPHHRSLDPQTWFQGSEYWTLVADLHMIRLKFLFPVLTTALLGGLVALIYGVVIYGPVVAMLRGLPLTGS